MVKRGRPPLKVVAPAKARSTDVATKAGTKTYAPTVAMTKAGPDDPGEPVFATKLREQRDKATANLDTMRAKRRELVAAGKSESKEKEAIDARIGEGIGEVKKLSAEILKEERAQNEGNRKGTRA